MISHIPNISNLLLSFRQKRGGQLIVSVSDMIIRSYLALKRCSVHIERSAEFIPVTDRLHLFLRYARLCLRKRLRRGNRYFILRNALVVFSLVNYSRLQEKEGKKRYLRFRDSGDSKKGGIYGKERG